MPEYRFIDYAEEVLKNASHPLTYQEIWELGLELGIREKLDTSGSTPEQTLGARLFVDVRDEPNSKFLKIGSNPARFFLKERENEINQELLDKISKDEDKHVKKKRLSPGFHVAKSVKLHNLDNPPTLGAKTGDLNQYYMNLQPK